MLKWLLSLFGSSEAGPPVTIESLQGTWLMVSVGKNGNFAPPQYFANSKILMVIKGDRYKVIANGNESDSGRIVFDPSKSPAHFDHHVTGGDDAGEVHLGIVRFRDGLLENCQGDKGCPRPKNFSRKRNDGASLATFKKQGRKEQAN